jgi:hypothetical protein
MIFLNVGFVVFCRQESQTLKKHRQYFLSVLSIFPGFAKKMNYGQNGDWQFPPYRLIPISMKNLVE